MIRIVCGTRPEALKILPILRVLAQRKIAFEVVHTGQHESLIDGTGLRPDHHLHVASQNDPWAYVEAAREALNQRFSDSKPPEWVVVQGDTASALAGARWAREQRVKHSHDVKLCHVEAGLRSHDENDPWPEELFRRLIDTSADLHCCPTPGNLANLQDVYVNLNAHVTGNTIVDQLRAMNVQRSHGSHVLITLHRREAFGEPLRQILNGLVTVARQYPDTPFLWPVHPNPKVKEALDAVELPPNVLTRGPLRYAGFIEMLASARAVLTDSGGVIEEATTLGVPTVIARDKTERPEALNQQGGTATLAGKTSHGIRNGFLWAMEAPTQGSDCFGDGRAAERIVDLLT